MSIYVVTTDASIFGSGIGVGAWGVCIATGQDEWTDHIGDIPVPCGINVAEFWAIYEGILYVPTRSQVIIQADNVRAMAWASRSFRPSKKNLLATVLYRQYHAVVEAKMVQVIEFQKIKSHATENKAHNRLDFKVRRLARQVHRQWIEDR